MGEAQGLSQKALMKYDCPLWVVLRNDTTVKVQHAQDQRNMFILTCLAEADLCVL